MDERYAKSQKLRVFYGWSRINKVRKKQSLSVIFENGRQGEERTTRFISRMQDTIYVREQSEGEKGDALGVARMFTEYSLFIDEKPFYGSLKSILEVNFEKDKNNVSEKERLKIKEALLRAYTDKYPRYKEPRSTQLTLSD